ALLVRELTGGTAGPRCPATHHPSLLIESAFPSDRINSSLEVSPMRKINLLFAVALLVSVNAFLYAQSADVQRYQLPPKEVVDAFDAQPLPTALLSPTKQMF